MALLSIDQSSGLQQNDIALPASGDVINALNTYFAGSGWTSTVIQAAKVSAFSGLSNTIDLALTNSSGGNLNGVDSGLNDLSGNDILLYTDTANNNLVLGKVGGTEMFALYLDATGSAAGSDANATGADLWMVEFKPIQHPDATNPNDVVSIHDAIYTTVTNPISFNATKAPSGSSLFVAIGDGTPQASEVSVIVTALGAAVSGPISGGEVVKASQAGSSLGGATFGVGSQHFDKPGGSAGADGDLAYFTFVTGQPSGLTVPNLDQGEADVESNIQFTKLFGATKVSFVVCQLQGNDYSTVKIGALVAGVQNTGPTNAISDDTPWTGNAYIDHQDTNTQVDIDTVTITRGADSWTFTEGMAKPAGAPSNLNVDFSQDNGLSVVISGVAEADKIQYETAVEHDRLLISNPGNSDAKMALAFDIGAIKIEAGGTSSSLLGPIDVYDDGPTITAVTSTTASVRHDETAGVQSDTDVPGTAFVSGGAGATVASLFTGIGGSAIGYARSTDPLATVTGGSAGTDGPATQELSYGLSVVNGTYSGVETTGGTRIFMYNGTGALDGLILGRVGNELAAGDTANASGAVAFALAVNSVNGEVFLSQYLTLSHPTGGTSYDETISLADGAVQATVSRADKDGDTAVDSNNNIGTLVKFDDDGPGLTPQAAGSLTPNDLKVDNDLSDAADSTAASSYGLLPGADGQKSYAIVGPEDADGVYRWTYDDASHTAITGTYRDANSVDHDLYTLVLNTSTGGYTFTMIGELPGSTLDLNPAEVIKAGAPDAPLLQIGLVQNDQYVEMSADSTVAGANGNINESHGFVGVDNGNLDNDESMTFTLHESNGTLITFEGIQIGTKTAGTSTYSWSAHVVGGGTITSSADEVVGKNGMIIVDAADLGGATIDSITIFKETGSATKIGVGDIHIIVPAVDIQLGFSVELKDGDNDTASQSFVVDIDGNNDHVWGATVNALSLPVGPDPSLLSAADHLHADLLMADHLFAV